MRLREKAKVILIFMWAGGRESRNSENRILIRGNQKDTEIKVNDVAYIEDLKYFPSPFSISRFVRKYLIHFKVKGCDRKCSYKVITPDAILPSYLASLPPMTKLPSVQSLYDLCKKTFTSSASGSVASPQAISTLCSLLGMMICFGD